MLSPPRVPRCVLTLLLVLGCGSPAERPVTGGSAVLHGQTISAPPDVDTAALAAEKEKQAESKKEDEAFIAKVAAELGALSVAASASSLESQKKESSENEAENAAFSRLKVVDHVPENFLLKDSSSACGNTDLAKQVLTL